jgi:Kef-type K+ transport system membrane component KefB
MLLAGLEMHPKELAESSKRSLFIALGGMLVPLASGFALGWFSLPTSDYRAAQSLFLGTAIAITAVPVAVEILMSLDLLKTDAGQAIVSSAIFDDILSLILLTVLTALIRTGRIPNVSSVALLAGKIALFFLLTITAGRLLLPRAERLLKSAVGEEVEFSVLLAFGLAFAVLAEFLELHFVLGAFLAGLFFTRRALSSKIYETVHARVSGITYGFLAPVFFASIGLRLDTSALLVVPGLMALVLVLAMASKWLGAGLPALLLGHSKRTSLLIGACMNARGAVGLIIADIALRHGLFKHPSPAPPVVKQLFSMIVIMAVVTTLLTPLTVHWLLSRNRG